MAAVALLIVMVWCRVQAHHLMRVFEMATEGARELRGGGGGGPGQAWRRQWPMGAAENSRGRGGGRGGRPGSGPKTGSICYDGAWST